MDALTKWTFQETNVLRIKSVEHHRADEVPPSLVRAVNGSVGGMREVYTINDMIVSFLLSEVLGWECCVYDFCSSVLMCICICTHSFLLLCPFPISSSIKMVNGN